jgi:hypothetical protein
MAEELVSRNSRIQCFWLHAKCLCMLWMFNKII